MSDLPGSWPEARARLVRLLGDGPGAEAAADAFLDQAVEACWGSRPGRVQRTIALQKLSGVVLALEDERGDIAFTTGLRALLAAVFARYFLGAHPDGPPFRLDPTETDRPPFVEWQAAFTFDDLIERSV